MQKPLPWNLTSEKFVEYSFKQLDELELAYAITIHKAQGSEYPAVVIPLLHGPRMLDEQESALYGSDPCQKMCDAGGR